jgi:hypothetical protein
MNGKNAFQRSRGIVRRARRQWGKARVSPAAKFALGIHLRYAVRRQWLWRILDLVLQHSDSGVILQVNRREGDQNIAVALRLLLLRWGDRAEKSRADDSRTLGSRRWAASDVLLFPIHRRFLRSENLENAETWQKVSQRSPMVLQKGRGKPETLLDKEDGQPPIKVNRRFSAAENEPRDTSWQRMRRVGEHELSATRHANNRQSFEPMIDINHLTDRVIRAIDHRIVAHRERIGRP